MMAKVISTLNIQLLQGNGKDMKKICILDPGLENNQGVPSSNLGDLIIQEAVDRELRKLFNGYEVLRFSTQSSLDAEHFREIQRCDHVFLGGTNILSSNMNRYRQWKISLLDALKLQKVILFGVGWWQYQEPANLYTQILLRLATSNKILHSVRDEYTRQKLCAMGVSNVINTGCPTMWTLMNQNFSLHPKQKSDRALLMLTDYNKQPELDRKLIELLLEQYETVYFWPQGRGDLQYVEDMALPLKILGHSLEDLQALLKSNIAFDYIGTRLHGGIYCLRSGRRSLIVEIDNRASEISRDTGLPVVARDDFAFMRNWISGSSQPQILLNCDAINTWRKQFAIDG